MTDILIILLLLSHSIVHTISLNQILYFTNNGRIWKKSLSKTDKRQASISLAHVVSLSIVAGLMFLVVI